MRRPLVLCVVSFLLGVAAVRLLRQRRSAVDSGAPVAPARAGAPDGRLSGTLDDLLTDDALVDDAVVDDALVDDVLVDDVLVDDVLVDHDAFDERWTAVEVAPGPHPGSALPLPDGGAPSDEFTVKGIADRFHTTESPHYPRVRAQLWFRNPTDAERAGLHRWDA